jgi:hypothetical protein
LASEHRIAEWASGKGRTGLDQGDVHFRIDRLDGTGDCRAAEAAADHDHSWRSLCQRGHRQQRVDVSAAELRRNSLRVRALLTAASYFRAASQAAIGRIWSSVKPAIRPITTWRRPFRRRCIR